MCTLAICKPTIRKVAKCGDWIAGTGSMDAPSGDLSGHLIYAMKVEEKITIEEYDLRAPSDWPHRIPNIKSLDLSERLGDCIYDYSCGTPKQRASVHGKENIKTDLGGENVLISREFYYFGSRAIKLPDNLFPICHQTQGHKSDSNTPYFEMFVSWIRGTELSPGQLYGWPDFVVDWNANIACGGCLPRKIDDENDIPC